MLKKILLTSLVIVACTGLTTLYSLKSEAFSVKDSANTAKDVVSAQQKPVVSNITVSPSKGYVKSTSFKLNARIKSSYALKQATATIKTKSGSTLGTLYLFDNGLQKDGAANDGLYGAVWSFNSGTQIGTYYFDISVKDASGNTVTITNAATITLAVDYIYSTGTKPAISSVSVKPASGIPQKTSFTLNAKVVDSEGVQSVTANIKNSSGTTMGWLTLYDNGYNNDGRANDGVFGSIWTFGKNTKVGTYNFTIQAKDKKGNIGTLNSAAKATLYQKSY